MSSKTSHSTLRLTFIPSFDMLPLKEQIVALFEGNTSETKRLPSSDFTQVHEFEISLQGKKRRFVYKEFLFRNIRDRFSVVFRKSRAMRAWVGAELLMNHGFGTAIPVCVGEQKTWGPVKRNFLVTEAIGDAQGVDEFIKNHYSSVTGQEIFFQKRKLLKLLGETIGRLHSLGIFQGDLRPGNVLIQDGDPQKIHLIDNERTRKYSTLSDRKRLKNLVQINLILAPTITRADRARFFYAYLEENPGLILSKKEWMKKIVQKTRVRMRRKGWIPA